MKRNNINIDEIIKRAVKEGLAAGVDYGYSIKKQEVKSYYQQTEKRLYAYPSLKDGIKDYEEHIKELQENGLPEKSGSIVFMPSGSRLTGDDLLEAEIQDLQFKIYSNKREIKNIEDALKTIENDEYYKIIKYRYFKIKSDKEIADEMFCDVSTIRRNKKRLINRLAVRLYGADAL